MYMWDNVTEEKFSPKLVKFASGENLSRSKILVNVILEQNFTNFLTKLERLHDYMEVVTLNLLPYQTVI